MAKSGSSFMVTIKFNRKHGMNITHDVAKFIIVSKNWKCYRSTEMWPKTQPFMKAQQL